MELVLFFIFALGASIVVLLAFYKEDQKTLLLHQKEVLTE